MPQKTSLIPLIACLFVLFSLFAPESVMGTEDVKTAVQTKLLPKDDTPGETALDRVVDPDEYVVGPGDQLTIVFAGKLVQRHDLTVTPEGVLLVPEFGPVSVAHETLVSAKQRIIDALHSRYKNVSLFVYLTQLRRVKVSVSGLVEFPGVYTLSAAERVSEAINMAGETRPDASSRNITLIRDGVRHNVDLMKYFKAGDRASNPYLHEGDIIVVPAAERAINRVGIFGAVKGPGSFEYVTGDRLSDLLMLAYGLTTDADSFDLDIVRFERDDILERTIEVQLPRGDAWGDSVESIELMPDDRVFFRSVPEFHKAAQVEVFGEVVYPGSYPVIEDSTRISDVIEMAGGLTENASLSEAWMDRSGFESLQEGDIETQLKLSANELDDVEKEFLKHQSAASPGRVSIDFWRLLLEKDSSYDITLKNGDRIHIPRLSRTVRVIGKVLRPGLIEFAYGQNADFYIDQAGGFGWKANKGKVRVVKSASGAIVKPSKKVPIEVGDAIVVPEKVPIDWWKTVKDVGMFLANIATVYIVIDQIIEK